MSSNFTEETKDLFRLLRTESFRFILVQYNHFSLVTQLKEELFKRFPDRKHAEIDGDKINYRDFMDAFFALERGFLFIQNFETVINNKEIYPGLNMRRDKISQHPVAMICFISPSAKELYAREIMERMPDLWSFRSMILDLQKENIVPEFQARDYVKREFKMSTLGGDTEASKQKELKRLIDVVYETEETETALLKILYEQIKDIQTDLAQYTEVIKTIEKLEQFDNTIFERIQLELDKAYIYEMVGEFEKSKKNLEKAKKTTNTLPLNESSEKIADTFLKLGNACSEFMQLDDALSFYERANKMYNVLFKIQNISPDLKYVLALSYEKLGQTHEALGNLTMSLKFYEQRSELGKQLYEAFPNDVIYKKGVAISYFKLGQTHEALGNLSMSLKYYEEEAVLFEQLRESFPNNMDFKNGLAISYSKLGSTYSALGNLTKSLKYHEDEAVLFEQLYDAFPKNTDYKNGLAISYSKLGSRYAVLGNLKKSLKYHEEYNSLMKQISESFPNNVYYKNGLAASYSKLGETHSSLGNLKESLNFCEKSNYLVKQLYKSFPNNVEYKNGLAISYEKLAYINSLLGNLIKSVKSYGESNKLMKQLYDSFPNNVGFKNGFAISCEKLGEINLILQNFDKASYNFSMFLKLSNELSVDFPDSSSYQSNFAEALSINAILKKTNSSHNDLKKAKEIFQSLYLKNNNPYYKEKIELIDKMLLPEQDFIPLILEISSF